jgi:hypothetical protein
MSLEPPPSKPIIASGYKLHPGFGGQAYDHKLSTARTYPDYHKNTFLINKSKNLFSRKYAPLGILVC